MTRVPGIEQRLGLPVKARARTRRVPGKMNLLEEQYSKHLRLRQLTGEIHAWHYEPLRFKLADLTTYTPDFLVIMSDGMVEIHEVKGSHWEQHARVKIKVAAAMYPYFTWRAFQKPRVREPWVEEVFRS